MIKVAPSVLSADFAVLGEEIRTISESGADYVHFDVMDGVFVPNITVGFPVLKSVRKITDLPIDVHLMICDPQKYAGQFCDAGADLITFHYETVQEENIIPILEEIRSKGKKAGIAIRPHTPVSVLEPYISLCDIILHMTVEPGFGGQSFMYDTLEKLSELKELIDRINPACELEVDGGINGETGALCAEHGANVFVAGSYFFTRDSRAEKVKLLKGQAE